MNGAGVEQPRAGDDPPPLESAVARACVASDGPADEGRDAPVFVVGHGRSGTTLLRLMLNELPRLAIPPETAFVSTFKRALERGVDLSDGEARRALIERMLAHRWIREGWVEGRGIPCDELLALGLAAAPEPGAIIDALMSRWARGDDKLRWGDKVPNNYRFLDELDAWFPRCKVVHLVRDGRDVALSCLTPPFSDRFDMGDVYEVALRWGDAIRRGRRAAERMGPKRYHELHYEDLTLDTERVLRALCRFLGEDYEPRMQSFHEHFERNVPGSNRHHHPRLRAAVDGDRIARWRREAERGFVVAFEALAGDELAACGYAPSGYGPTALQRLRIAWEKSRPRQDVARHFRPRGRRLRNSLRKALGAG